MQLDIPSSTFCILPWTHMATFTNGDISTCCIAPQMRDINLNSTSLKEAWNHSHFKKTRLQMLQGKQIDRCQYCYKQEASGLSSHRTDENKVWLKKNSTEELNKLINNTNKNGSLAISPSTLDLRPGNICNLKCVICSPGESTAWYSDAVKLLELLESNVKYDWLFKCRAASKGFGWYSNKTFIKEFYDLLPDLKHIIWGGGEPLMLKEHDQFLTDAIEGGYAENIELRYHTNGTLLTQKHINSWAKFKKVQVMLSIDNIEEKNYLLRYPCNWDRLCESIQLLDQSPRNIEPQLQVTVSALNIPDLPEIADWIIAQKFKKMIPPTSNSPFHLGIVFWPPYLSPTVLMDKTKKRITNKLNQYVKKQSFSDSKSLIHVVNHMNSQDDSKMLKETIDYLQSLSKLRNQDYLCKFPHIKNDNETL